MTCPKRSLQEIAEVTWDTTPLFELILKNQVAVPKMAVWELPCRQLSGNSSFGLCVLVVVEYSSFQKRFDGVRYLTSCHLWGYRFTAVYSYCRGFGDLTPTWLRQSARSERNDSYKRVVQWAWTRRRGWSSSHNLDYVVTCTPQNRPLHVLPTPSSHLR